MRPTEKYPLFRETVYPVGITYIYLLKNGYGVVVDCNKLSNKGYTLHIGRPQTNTKDTQLNYVYVRKYGRFPRFTGLSNTQVEEYLDEVNSYPRL